MTAMRSPVMTRSAVAAAVVTAQHRAADPADHQAHRPGHHRAADSAADGALGGVADRERRIGGGEKGQGGYGGEEEFHKRFQAGGWEEATGGLGAAGGNRTRDIQLGKLTFYL